MARTAVALAKQERIDPFIELGRTGLDQSWGQIHDQVQRDLRDPTKRRKLLRELRDTSPVIDGAFRAIDNTLRQTPTRVEPGGEAPEDQQAAELVKTALGDMSSPWSQVVTQALTCKEYGWAVLEIVYKRRQGPDQRDAAKRSEYTDGRIAWRKFVIRAQESHTRWIFDESGGVQAFVQQVMPFTTGQAWAEIEIPIDKLLLFRIDDQKGSPEGRSLILNCVTPWKFVKRIQELEAIGIERDLAGLPVLYAPPEVLSAHATGDMLATQAALKSIVTNVRRDEQEGVLMPGQRDANGNRLYELTLLSTGGQRQFNVDAVVQRYEQRMLVTLLADFLTLGSQKTGSYALSEDKTDLFQQSLGVYLDAALMPFNQYAIPRLMKLNGLSAKKPMIKRGEIGSRDLPTLGAFLQQLAAAGLIMPTTDGSLEKHLLEIARLPVPEEIQVQPVAEPPKPSDQTPPEKPAGSDLVKYSEDQPRVPAGSGDPSGEWTAAGGGGGEESSGGDGSGGAISGSKLVSLMTKEEADKLSIPHSVHSARREDIDIEDGVGGYRPLRADEARGHVLVVFGSKDMRRLGLRTIGTPVFVDALTKK